MNTPIATLASLLILGTANAEPAGLSVASDRAELRFDSNGTKLQGRLWLPAGQGPHPALVFVAGSGRSIRDLDLDKDPLPNRFTSRGIAFFAYDKRGVRDSEGVFSPLPDSGRSEQTDLLQTLARDAGAALRAVGNHRRIDSDRVGLWAFSQGGWVASQIEQVGASPALLIAVGGPTVTVAEENAFSAIADRARLRSRSGAQSLSMRALEAEFELWRERADLAGSFNPAPDLARMSTPTLWLLGSWDLSVPALASYRVLQELGEDRGSFDPILIPHANHGLARMDAAGAWHIPQEVWELQYEFLLKHGFLEPQLRTKIQAVVSR